MADGTIRRVKLKFERDYTQIPNDWLRDERLTLKARGLLALLMSHDAGYTVSVRSLTKANREGRAAMDAAIAELKEHDYLEHEIVRGRYGRIEGVIWQLTDPADVAERKRRSPQLDLPDAGKPDMRETRQPDNRHLKEAQPEEQPLLTSQPNPSTRAGVKKDALSGDSRRAAADQACVAWRRSGAHTFTDQDPRTLCELCGRVDLIGNVYDAGGHIVLAIASLTTGEVA